MKNMRIPTFVIAMFAYVLVFTATVAIAADPLPSWNEGKAKQSIIDFVKKITTPNSPDFVPISERIATFDNDGTLWSEQPMPTQLYFAVDRVKALVPQHPEWKEKEPFASIIKGDYQSALAGGEPALMQLLMQTHAGMTTDEFTQIVKDWIATAKNPKTNLRFLDMTYQPMLEVISYLRTNGFKIYIVSGGGIEFMRSWAEQSYGIPPEQIIGSSIKTKFELQDGKAVLVRLPELNFNDDKDGKPVGINQYIGRRPIAAFGNSVGDQQMLEYTQGGSGARFELLVLHDDATREFAYGPARGLPHVKLGYFTPALDELAKKNGWTVVSMKNDWKTIFGAAKSDIIAIDILLEPDAKMLKHAKVNNARLLNVYPQGFRLDAAHKPHITMIQCFVHAADLNKIYNATEKVIAKASVKNMKLEAFKYYYVPTKDLGVAGIVIKPTTELLNLQANIIAAVVPYTVKTGPIDSFTDTHNDSTLDAQIIDYVSEFVQKNTGEHYNPHVTTGVASKKYLDKMLTEPFANFNFSLDGVAVYQLGPFGTAAKKLKEWDLKP